MSSKWFQTDAKVAQNDAEDTQSDPKMTLKCPQSDPKWRQSDPKVSQICVLLLQVASLDDLNHVSDIILMTSSCMRHYVGDILTYPTWF